MSLSIRISVLLVVFPALAALQIQSPARAENPPPAAQTPDESLSAKEQLAHRYAPVLYLKQQSARCAPDGDPFDPAPVELVLDNPQVQLRGARRETLVEGPTAEDIFRSGPETYLNFPGNPLSPGCRYEIDYLAMREDQPAVAYAHVTREEDREGVVLQYWFFYYFNDWNNNHEGDWELIQLVFEAESVEAALMMEPDRVSYAQHGGGERADWDSNRVRKENGRPVVYVASGSHASQFAPRVYLGKGEPGTGFGCDDASGPHRRVEPEVRVFPETVDSAEDEFAWLTFEGRRGQRLPGHNNGPTGPNMKRYFTAPLTWEETHRDHSIVIPGRNLLGTQGVSSFCDIAAFGGNALLAFTDRPVLVGVSGAVVAGALLTVGASLVLAVWRSGSSEVYGPDSLRARRTVGQIIRAAAHIYHLHWRPLLLMAVVLVPVGALIVALQQLLLAVPYVSTIFDLAGDRGFNAFVTIIYGYGVNLPVFVLVTAAVIAAMHQLELGEEPSPRQCYRHILRNVRPILLARLRAVLIITLLFVSIIGIPVAIYFMVRWLFIEETIVLSGSSREDAAARSGMLVYRHWWRTFFMAAVLGALGGFSTPFLVLILIMWTPVPLGVINVISALAYAALLPFIGIMLTLLYWDLSARYAETTGLDPIRHERIRST